MTKHDGLPVSGYNPQSPENVARVNTNKELEERCLRAIENCRDNGADPRMTAIAMTQLQQAFMWANRAVFQPSRVKLPEDQ